MAGPSGGRLAGSVRDMRLILSPAACCLAGRRWRTAPLALLAATPHLLALLACNVQAGGGGGKWRTGAASAAGAFGRVATSCRCHRLASPATPSLGFAFSVAVAMSLLPGALFCLSDRGVAAPLAALPLCGISLFWRVDKNSGRGSPLSWTFFARRTTWAAGMIGCIRHGVPPLPWQTGTLAWNRWYDNGSAAY